MDEISFDQRTFGDGVPISTDGEWFFDQRTMEHLCRFVDEISMIWYGSYNIIYEDSWMRYLLINVHLGMGSPYLQMENGFLINVQWNIYADSWMRYLHNMMESRCRFMDEIL